MRSPALSIRLLALGVALPGAPPAADIGVVSTKLLVVDKLTAAGKAKLAFVSKDTTAGITKGTGISAGGPSRISVKFRVVYGNGSALGAFTLPAGASVDKSPGWVVNKSTVAKYVNKLAPGGPTQAKVAVIKPDKLLKLVGKGLGDEPLDIFGEGDPGGAGVQTAYCVLAGTQTNCHCSSFTACVHKPIAGGTGAKLVCKTSTADASCSAAPACMDLGATVGCDDLEWEKKNTAVGSGPDPGNLHDVDNRYSWTGQCMTGSPFRCQPNAAAAATCAAQTGLVSGCEVCDDGDAACDVDPFDQGAITTIWDWLNQVNAAGLGGHSDWRVPTSVGGFGPPTGGQGEIDSIVDLTQGSCDGGSGACIDPVFGPTGEDRYWSASSIAGVDANDAWAVSFTVGGMLHDHDKGTAHFVRAVRSVP